MDSKQKLEILAMLLEVVQDRSWQWEEDLIESTAMSKLERVLKGAYQDERVKLEGSDG